MTKVAMVTGAGRGLGAAISRSLAAAGFAIGLNYNQSPEKAQRLAKELISVHGTSALAVQADVSDLAQARRMIGIVRAELGDVEILINNAGRRDDGMFAFQDPARFWGVMATNVGGVVNCCKAVLPAMLARRSGTIINISSISGRRGVAGQTAYSASKAAVEGFTRSLAKEVGPQGIAVVCVAPGLLSTDMAHGLPQRVVDNYIASSPIGRLGTAEEVARMITLLATQLAPMCQGQVLVMDGGATA